jgi:anti-anti-sigma factor
MLEQTKQIRIERQGRMMVVTPSDNLGELEFEEFEPETRSVQEQYERSDVQHLVVDLHNAEFLGSSTLGWLLELRRLVHSRHGQMALCGVSPTAREVLEVTRLADHWPIYASREEAVVSFALLRP